MTVVLNGREDFSLENFRRVTAGLERVEIGDEATRVMEEARANFLRLLESDRSQFIYGVTSNFGIRAKVAIPPEEQREHARRYGGRGLGGRGFGRELLDERVVRGIVFARLTNFVAGNSKARATVAKRLAALLDGPMAPVPIDGQVGAGEILPMAHVLRDFDRSDLEEGEGNALSNGSPCSAALVADVALEARNRLSLATAIFALSVEAFRAPLSAYDIALDDLWGDEDEAASLQALRALLEGASTDDRRFHQAPVSYRILGRVLGQCRRAVACVEHAAEVSLRSVTDNPVYVPPDDDLHPFGRAFSTGGYHNAMAYPALNGLTAAWADLAFLAERQVTALSTPETSGLPLDARIGLFSWVVSGFVEEARAAAVPALLPAAVNDPQDDVSSPVFSAYRRELRAAECIDHALSGLAVEASQALFFMDRRPAPPLEELLGQIRSIFPPVDDEAETREFGEETGRLALALGRAARAGSFELVTESAR